MKSKIISSSAITTTVSLLFIVLFVYAAASKLLDFENFKVQLGQSPLLSAFASWLVWFVPAMEIILSLFLVFSKHKFWSLLAAYNLMVMFTVYIYIILNFASFVPCSCGGILEKMGWTEHLVFNLGFVVLALIAIFMNNKESNNETHLSQ